MQKQELQDLIANTEKRVRDKLIVASVIKADNGDTASHVIEDAIDVILDELIVQFEMEA